MNYKSTVYFLSGLVLGSAAGVLVAKAYLKKKYWALCEERIQEMMDYFKRTDEYARKEKDPSFEDTTSFDNESVYPVSPEIEVLREDGVLSPEKRAEIKEKLKRNRDEIATHYAGIYENPDPAELEHPEEETEEFYGSFAPPKILTLTEVGYLGAEIERICIHAYDDGIFTDEEDNIVEHIEACIGDVLSSDEYVYADEDDPIFILNERDGVCYEILKHDHGFEADSI